ncbi:flagellar basal body P-ring formation protein FlgA [Microvirga sp. SM9]|nr:flagellar basal body P-ring formation chaperone FlgA [Microvirga lenta]MCB5173568.1 flagellar basal body P-ring formation protein FlgA [Microvirga lenta]
MMNVLKKQPTRKLLAALAMLVVGTQSGLAEQLVLPVPSVTIYPGDIIKDSMLRERTFPPNFRARLAVVDSTLALVGKTARRTLLPGEAIPSNAIDEPKIVIRGAPTEIIFQEQGLTITAMGTPLQPGSLGEMIRVRNIDTGRIVHGVVQADGRVRIGN